MYTKQRDGKDAMTWALPEGAIARLGRGWIRNSMAFSPDGTHLVVATDIGCWWYDLATMDHHALWETERGMVSAISFSHDARWIATGNLDGIVKIWDSRTLQRVAKIDVPDNPEVMIGGAAHLTFSPDGQHLTRSNAIARGGTHCTVYAWLTNTDTPITSFTVKPKPRRRNDHPKVFSSDGNLFAYTSDVNITSVLHVETGEHIAVLSDEYTDQLVKGCYKLVFSPCGQYLAASNWGNKVHIWNVHNGTFEMTPTVYSENPQINWGIPAYTPDGTLRVAGLSSKEVVLWDATQQETVDTFESWGPSGAAVRFSADGTRLAVTNRRGELQVWSAGYPSTVTPLSVHLSSVVRVGFTKDNRTLVSGHSPRAGHRVWNVARQQARQPCHFLNANPNSPNPIVTSRDNELLATTEEDTIKVWYTVSGTKVAELTENPLRVYTMAFSPTGEYLVSASRRSCIKVWHVASGTQVAELTENPLSMVYSMAFSPTGEYFVTVYRESVTVWDAQRWEKLHHASLIPQSQPRWKLVFHPNGKSFFTSSPRGKTLAWDLNQGEQLASLSTAPLSDITLYKGTSQDIQRVFEQQAPSPSRIWDLQFSPCGTLLACGMLDEIRVWNANTLETSMAIIPPTGCQKPYALAFSPCSRYLASGCHWQEMQEKVSIRLWEVATGENIHTFWGHPTDVLSLDFSSDGCILASGSYDGTILLWNMKPYL